MFFRSGKVCIRKVSLLGSVCVSIVDLFATQCMSLVNDMFCSVEFFSSREGSETDEPFDAPSPKVQEFPVEQDTASVLNPAVILQRLQPVESEGEESASSYDTAFRSVKLFSSSSGHTDPDDADFIPPETASSTQSSHRPSPPLPVQRRIKKKVPVAKRVAKKQNQRGSESEDDNSDADAVPPARWKSSYERKGHSSQFVRFMTPASGIAKLLEKANDCLRDGASRQKKNAVSSEIEEILERYDRLAFDSKDPVGAIHAFLDLIGEEEQELIAISDLIWEEDNRHGVFTDGEFLKFHSCLIFDV